MFSSSKFCFITLLSVVALLTNVHIIRSIAGLSFTSTQDKEARPSWKSTVTHCDSVDVNDHRASVRQNDQKAVFRSQRYEDKHLLRWFNGLCGGRYLEMGALDGKWLSNTYAYQALLNWTGVLVELNPRDYEKILINRPKDIAVNAAVCDQARTLHWVQAEGKAGAAVDGVWEFAAPSFREEFWNGVELEDTMSIECSPLQSLLDKHAPHIGYYDFYSLDIEGAELHALKSIDFTKTAFGIILVEADGRNVLKDSAVRSILERNGYEYMHEMNYSSWFINRDWDKIYSHVLL